MKKTESVIIETTIHRFRTLEHVVPFTISTKRFTSNRVEIKNMKSYFFRRHGGEQWH